MKVEADESSFKVKYFQVTNMKGMYKVLILLQQNCRAFGNICRWLNEGPFEIFLVYASQDEEQVYQEDKLSLYFLSSCLLSSYHWSFCYSTAATASEEAQIAPKMHAQTCFYFLIVIPVDTLGFSSLVYGHQLGAGHYLLL